MAILNQKEVRVAIISRIWAYATAMLLISFLFSSKARDSKAIFLPLTVVFGATTSTIVVLRKLRERYSNEHLTFEALQEFKQRLENLEEIVISNPELLNRSPQQIDRTKERSQLI